MLPTLPHESQGRLDFFGTAILQVTRQASYMSMVPAYIAQLGSRLRFTCACTFPFHVHLHVFVLHACVCVLRAPARLRLHLHARACTSASASCVHLHICVCVLRAPERLRLRLTRACTSASASASMPVNSPFIIDLFLSLWKPNHGGVSLGIFFFNLLSQILIWCNLECMLPINFM